MVLGILHIAYACNIYVKMQKNAEEKSIALRIAFDNSNNNIIRNDNEQCNGHICISV